MLSSYQYLFYKFYKISERAEGTWAFALRMPHLIAFILLLVLNVWIIIGITLAIKIKGDAVNLFYYGGVSTFLIINYPLFLSNKKYNYIIEKFDSESENIKKSKSLFFWGFILGVIIFFFLI